VQQLIIETMLMVVKIVMLIDDGGDVWKYGRWMLEDRMNAYAGTDKPSEN
jgi:hypothetical protein